jgi:hypothetical protein|tara:strand:+ start:2511 stop:2729 length:219 start_codon:yes stop_codon:yes gene_type:complete
MKTIYDWLISLFIHRYQIRVSFNKEYGDADDKVYISKKVLVQKENHLKFRDMNNKIIEYRSAGGLNYIIEDM